MSPQSYPISSQFTSDDFNLLANDINEIIGIGAGDAGYGQNQLFVNHVNKGQRLMKKNWMELFYAMTFSASHQGTTLTTPNSLFDGDFETLDDIIYHIDTIRADINNIRGNKLNSNIGKMSLQNNVTSIQQTYVDNIGSVDPDELWETINIGKNVIFKTTFADSDAIRWHFNSGGDIRISTELSIDSAPLYIPSIAWNELFNSIGVIIIKHSETVSSNQIGTPGIGFTGLTSEWQQIYTRIYSELENPSFFGNSLTVYAKLSGDDSIEIDVTLTNCDINDINNGYNVDDFYCGVGVTGSDPIGTTNGSYVIGDLSIVLAQQRADDAHTSGLGVITEMPIYSVLSDISEINS
jgi:hypothetical protein